MTQEHAMNFVSYVLGIYNYFRNEELSGLFEIVDDDDDDDDIIYE